MRFCSKTEFHTSHRYIYRSQFLNYIWIPKVPFSKDDSLLFYRFCDKDTGRCSDGCATGYYLHSDNNCKACQFCINGSCDPITGSCDIGCIDGYFKAPNGFCSACSEACKDRICDRVTGACTKVIHILFCFQDFTELVISYGPGHAKMCLMCLMAYANNSLISTSVVRCLDSMTCILAISKVSRF